MVYAIQMRLGFRNTARRDAVADNIGTKFTAPQYGTPTTTNIALRPNGDPGLYIEARFINQVDRDALWADLDNTFGTGVNGPVTGSLAWQHDCPHDEGIGTCVTSLERLW